MMPTFQNAQAALSIAGTLSGTSGSMKVGNDVISWSVQGTLMGIKWKYIGRGSQLHEYQSKWLLVFSFFSFIQSVKHSKRIPLQ